MTNDKWQMRNSCIILCITFEGEAFACLATTDTTTSQSKPKGRALHSPGPPRRVVGLCPPSPAKPYEARARDPVPFPRREPFAARARQPAQRLWRQTLQPSTSAPPGRAWPRAHPWVVEPARCHAEPATSNPVSPSSLRVLHGALPNSTYIHQICLYLTYLPLQLLH